MIIVFCIMKKNILFCNNCEESLCNICIKSQNHKGHETNEIKFLDLKKLKDKCIKFKKNLAKKLEKAKLNIMGNKKNNFRFKNDTNNEIQIYIKKQKYEILDILDLIFNMIKDFDNYKNIKKLPNYIIYLNCRLIDNLISLLVLRVTHIIIVKIIKYINQIYSEI